MLQNDLAYLLGTVQPERSKRQLPHFGIVHTRAILIPQKLEYTLYGGRHGGLAQICVTPTGAHYAAQRARPYLA
jgi:hypothetical protein